MARAQRFGDRLRLQTILVTAIAAVVVLSVGVLAGVSYLSSRSIVSELGGRLIVRNLDLLERALRNELDAVVAQTRFIATALKAGKYDLSGRKLLAAFAGGSMAAAPRIGSLIVADDKRKALQLVRLGSGDIVEVETDIAADPLLHRIAHEARGQGGPFFIEPTYRKDLMSSLIGLTVPIRHEGKYFGFLSVSVLTRTLSRFTETLSRDPRVTTFILYGSDRVLAHPALVDGSPRLSEETPLLALHELDDTILAHLSEARPLRLAERSLPKGSEAMYLVTNGRPYRIYKRTLLDYGDVPLVIGAYATDTVFERVVTTLRNQALVGVALLLGGIVLAVLLGRTISRPIGRAARAARALKTLDFDRVGRQGPSRIREVNDLGASLNAALDGLQAFGRYVPRTLVARLIKEGRAGAGSEERVLSVMFTDIAGFSAMCETMPAKEVADFVNRHLTLLAECIEREGGTIDKYIGDAVMAFWGAPDTLDNTALPACRAALAIRSAIIEDNRMRAEQGLPPVRVRVGVHTGPLVVGDIGAPTRINYTIVGDVVNGGQRLEALGKEIDPEAEVLVLISGATAALLPPDFDLAPQGFWKVKGMERELEVFRLGESQSAGDPEP